MADNQESLSFGERIPIQEQRTFTVEAPAGELGFRIRLPQEWSEIGGIQAPPIAEGRLSPIAAFAAPDGATIQALATLLPYEVNLEDWLLLEAIEDDISLRDGRSVEAAWGRAVHAEGTAASGAPLRLLAAGDGPYIVLLIGRMDPEEHSRNQEALGLAAASFELTHHQGSRTREELCWHTHPEGSVRVACPVSWTLSRGDAAGLARPGIELTMQDENAASGRLRIETDYRFALDEGGKEEVSRAVLGEIEDAGFLVQSLETLPPGSDARREQWVGQCEREGRRWQLALWFLPAGGRWVTVSMLCPLHPDSPRGWLRGKRAFELATASIETTADKPL